MAKIGARIHAERIAESKVLKIIRKYGAGGHLGSVDEKRDDSDVPGERLSNLQTNKICRIIDTT